VAYDSRFIPGIEIPLPLIGDRIRGTAFNGGLPIEHSRFSILFNQERGFAIATAHNIDGESIIEAGVIPRRDRFRNDPNVPRHLQVDNDRGYRGDHNPWDRGHLVRRRSLHWGDEGDAVLADYESYVWTNIAPQHENLHDTAWGNIEDWMFEVTDNGDQRASVFTGPVLLVDDPQLVNRPGEEPIRIPAGFWKVIAIRHREELRAAAFLVWQRDYDRAEPLPFDPILEQIRLTTIEHLTGLSFGILQEADPLRFGADTERRDGRIRIRAASAHKRAGAISEPRDIVL
jgi:endonuclease G